MPMVLSADTGMEFPEMYEHLAKLDEHLFRERGIHITTLRHPKGFEYLMFDEPKQKPRSLENRAKLGIPPYGNGWPGIRVRWCTGQLKTHLITKEVNRLKGELGAIHYVGIAADEAWRCKDERYPLVEWGIKLKQSWSARDFALLSTEQIKALGLRSYTPARLELPETMPSRNDTPAVEVKDLAIGYEKGKPVAQHLNFRVYPGEIVGVVGKNGCGKSTLARTLCGLQKELRGEVLYQNSMIPSKRRIRKAYLVMQDPDYQLFTDSVYQELLLALSDQKDKDEKRIDDILDELNLTIYKERHPMSLSGGQKQRTAIGVAALRDAEVLIFDEPTSGLDYKNMESVAGILSALSKRGKAILVISHDNELLMKICSRVIRMDEKTSS